MTIQQQLTSREIGNQLLNLGVKKESYFVWHERGKVWEVIESHACGCMGTIPAYTVAELGELIPQSLGPTGMHYTLYQCPDYDHDGWQAYYATAQEVTHCMRGKTEVELRGKMLIYLLEHKLI